MLLRARFAWSEQGVAGEVMALERAATRRWRQGDPAGFPEICAPEITYSNPETPRRLDGLENLRAEYQKLAGKVHFDAMEFPQPIVHVHFSFIGEGPPEGAAPES